MHIFVRAKPNLLKTINTLGSTLADLRKARGFSQELLAEKAGLNLRTIQRIEKGETEPRGDSIIRLCQVLEVGPEELMVWAMVSGSLIHLTPYPSPALTALTLRSRERGAEQ